jgi:hypothetical protein
MLNRINLRIPSGGLGEAAQEPETRNLFFVPFVSSREKTKKPRPVRFGRTGRGE